MKPIKNQSVILQNNSINDNKCGICLDSVIIDKSNKDIICDNCYNKNYFHKSCIDNWLKSIIENKRSIARCPLCRNKLIIYNVAWRRIIKDYKIKWFECCKITNIEKDKLQIITREKILVKKELEELVKNYNRLRLWQIKWDKINNKLTIIKEDEEEYQIRLQKALDKEINICVNLFTAKLLWMFYDKLTTNIENYLHLPNDIIIDKTIFLLVVNRILEYL